MREASVKHHIRLRGINGEVEGKVWESDTILRAGRLASLEMVLDDSSVSRRHAEVRATDGGWRLRDLGSTNGTFLNGTRLTNAEKELKARDVIQFGKVAVSVEMIEEMAHSATVPKGETDPGPDNLLVEASTKSGYEDAIQGLVFDSNRCPRPGEQMMALLRAGHHLVHLESEDELLQSILHDAVAVLDAQRGAIVLAEATSGQLKLRALATGKRESHSRFTFSQRAAQRAFSDGESVLCSSVSDDPELATAQSIADGAMASVLCVLLRTPRNKKLGVLHLDRSFWQKPFTKEDLRLADALAASVSAGIECASLLRRERDKFLNTITILSQAVELRDPYTGGHTLRVTNYSMLLGEQMQLPEKEMNMIRIGGPLHDIGKIGIDDAILRKPGKLTDEEFEIMKSHTTMGAKFLALEPDLTPVIPIVRSHHERWDGRGYPDKLAGEAIDPLARIVAVADAFDAMTSDRPYRKGMAAEIAFAEVEKMAGKQFDPTAATAFLDIKERISEEMKNRHSTIQAADSGPRPASVH
jgi:HD-GYP domain-containing protein (c-di-GMP phosphodiesterase class II)